VAQLRPELTLDQVRAFLRGNLGREPDELRALRPGGLSRVYAYDLAGAPFVVRFNSRPEAFEADRVAHERFAGPGLPIPRVLELGRFGDLHFALSERLPGRIMWDIPAAEYDLALPALLDAHDRIAAIDPGDGFSREPWPAFLDAFARDHDEPGFWHGWRSLFDTSFLERDVWEGLYARFRALLGAVHDPGRLVHDAEQEVLGADPVVTEASSLAHRQLDHLPGARGEADLPHDQTIPPADDGLDGRAHRRQIDPQVR